MTYANALGRSIGRVQAALEDSAASAEGYLRALADGVEETGGYVKRWAITAYTAGGVRGAATRISTKASIVAVAALLSGDMDAMALEQAVEEELGETGYNTSETVNATEEAANDSTETVDETVDTVNDTTEDLTDEGADAYDQVRDELPDDVSDETPEEPLGGDGGDSGGQGNESPSGGNQGSDDGYQEPGGDPNQPEERDPAGTNRTDPVNDSWNGSREAVAADPAAAGSDAAQQEGNRDLVYAAAGMAGAGALAGGYAVYRAAQDDGGEGEHDTGEDKPDTELRDRSDGGRSLTRGSLRHLRNRGED